MTDKPDWMKVCSGINCDSCKSRKNKGKGDCLDFNIDKYPLITKYMGWEIHTSLDGNDMVAAISRMVGVDGFCTDWIEFDLFVKESGVKAKSSDWLLSHIPWLMQPASFFELMAKWLEEQR